MNCHNKHIIINRYLFLSFVSALLFAIPAHAVVINVNCTATVQTGINDAINNASEGDTIRISGQCVENVIINKGITLVGRNSKASLSPADTGRHTIRVVARNVVIENLILEAQSESIQIYITYQSFATIVNNVIGNSVTGVYVNANSLAVLVGNRIHDTYAGIFVGENSTARIGYREGSSRYEGNIIESNTTGISFFGSIGSVAKNKIINNSFGVYVAESSSVRIANNEIAENSYGILNTSQSDTRLAHNSQPDSIFGSSNYGTNNLTAFYCNSGSISDNVGSRFLPLGTANQDCLNRTVP